MHRAGLREHRTEHRTFLTYLGPAYILSPVMDMQVIHPLGGIYLMRLGASEFALSGSSRIDTLLWLGSDTNEQIIE